MERVKEMVDVHNKGGYIPRMIHLAYLQDEGVVCYDGNHRKEVFTSICGDANESMMCVVYKAFTNINNSVQLPAIYIEESNGDENNVKAEIIKLVRDYEVSCTKLQP